MRTFTKTLRQAVDRSGLNQKEIAERVRTHGAEMDASYLSKILCDACPPPSDRVVRALATVLDLDPVKLAVQAHIDRAPEDLRDRLIVV